MVVWEELAEPRVGTGLSGRPDGSGGRRIVLCGMEITAAVQQRPKIDGRTLFKQYCLHILSIVPLGLGVIGRNQDNQSHLKLHATFVAIFLAADHVAMTFGMPNPSLLM